MSEDFFTQNIHHNHSDDLDETESTSNYSSSTENETDDNEQQKSSTESSEEESTSSESSTDEHEEEEEEEEENKTSETSTEDEDEEKNTDETESTTSSEDEDENTSNYDLFRWFIIINGNDHYSNENIDKDTSDFDIRAKNLLNEVIVHLALELCQDVKITNHLSDNQSASFISCCFNYDRDNLTIIDYNKIKRMMKDSKISFAILFISSQTNIIDQNMTLKDLPIVEDNANDSEIIKQMTKLLSNKIKHTSHK